VKGEIHRRRSPGGRGEKTHEEGRGGWSGEPECVGAKGGERRRGSGGWHIGGGGRGDGGGGLGVGARGRGEQRGEGEGGGRGRGNETGGVGGEAEER